MKRALFTLLCLLASGSAEAAIERYAVIIGNNNGARDEPVLRYAEEDAAKLYDVLKDLGGFLPENLLLLKHENAETARRAVISFNDRIRARTSSGGQVMLLVYYSGHADGLGLHLGASTFEVEQLEQLVRGSASTFRLLILDSCRSGALTRVKGGRAAPPIPIALEQRMAGEGAVFLSSSAGSEDSQESDEVKGSFFTHYLISGLMGAADTDADGQVTLEEAYRYAYENTLRASSRTLAGLQHPTFRYEMHGHGEVVITTLGSEGRAAVDFPRGRSYLLMHDRADGPVAAEVGARDSIRRLSLKVGRYFVRGRGDDFLLEGTVVFVAGPSQRVEDRDLRRIEYARLVRKGRSSRALVHGLQAGYLLHTALSNSDSLCNGAFAGYQVELRHLSVTPQISYCRSGFDNATLHSGVDEFAVRVWLAHVWDLPVFSIEVGVSTGTALLRQTFETRGRAPDRLTGAWTLSVGLGLLRDLPKGFYLLARVEAETFFYEQLHDSGSSSFAPSVAARASFGFGKRW